MRDNITFTQLSKTYKNHNVWGKNARGNPGMLTMEEIANKFIASFSCNFSGSIPVVGIAETLVEA